MENGQWGCPRNDSSRKSRAKDLGGPTIVFQIYDRFKSIGMLIAHKRDASVQRWAFISIQILMHKPLLTNLP